MNTQRPFPAALGWAGEDRKNPLYCFIKDSFLSFGFVVWFFQKKFMWLALSTNEYFFVPSENWFAFRSWFCYLPSASITTKAPCDSETPIILLALFSFLDFVLSTSRSCHYFRQFWFHVSLRCKTHGHTCWRFADACFRLLPLTTSTTNLTAQTRPFPSISSQAPFVLPIANLTSWGGVLFDLSFVFGSRSLLRLAMLCFLSLILPITTTDADAFAFALFFVSFPTDSIYLSINNERNNLIFSFTFVHPLLPNRIHQTAFTILFASIVSRPPSKNKHTSHRSGHVFNPPPSPRRLSVFKFKCTIKRSALLENAVVVVL